MQLRVYALLRPSYHTYIEIFLIVSWGKFGHYHYRESINFVHFRTWGREGVKKTIKKFGCHLWMVPWWVPTIKNFFSTIFNFLTYRKLIEESKQVLPLFYLHNKHFWSHLSGNTMISRIDTYWYYLDIFIQFWATYNICTNVTVRTLNKYQSWKSA